MKYTLVFLDTETTGNTPGDYLCEVAYKVGGEIQCELFKPPVPIPPDASAVSHITNRMVAEKPVFKDSLFYPPLKSLLETESSILVAHNAVFDMGMIRKEGIEPLTMICTMRLMRYLDRDGIIPKYNLQFLRYYLDMDVVAQAHDAKGDVIVLEELFNHIFKKMRPDANSDDEVIERMVQISSQPSIFKTFNFGKYKGQKIEDVARTDRGYLEWLYQQKMQDEAQDEDWIFTLKHHLGVLQ